MIIQVTNFISCVRSDHSKDELQSSYTMIIQITNFLSCVTCKVRSFYRRIAIIITMIIKVTNFLSCVRSNHSKDELQSSYTMIIQVTNFISCVRSDHSKDELQSSYTMIIKVTNFLSCVSVTWNLELYLLPFILLHSSPLFRLTEWTDI